MTETFGTTVFGGINVADQAVSLMQRSHLVDQGRFRQVYPMETPRAINMDIYRDGIGKRKGSVLLTDVSTISSFVSGDVLVGGVEWTTPTTNKRVKVLVGKKTIYIDQSGSFVQVNDSASAAYTHAADVTEVSFLQGDNHLLILVNGANQVQVYRTGADLDPELKLSNTWNESIGGGTQTMTGTWRTNTQIGVILHGRLAMANGTDGIIEYTPAPSSTSGIWDLTNGGFSTTGLYHDATVIGLATSTPEFSNSLTPFLYIFTTKGVQVRAGFASGDLPFKIEGSGVPINKNCIVHTRNWLMFLTKEGNIEAINGRRVLNLGRRLRSLEADGPLDNFSASNSEPASDSTGGAFGYYDRDQEKAVWYMATSDQTTNAISITLDFKLGEPGLDEPLESVERHVRAFYGEIVSPGTNSWFVAAYERLGGSDYIASNGKIYTSDSGFADLDSLAIKSEYDTPEIIGRIETVDKNWLLGLFKFIPKGDWNVAIQPFLDRATDGETSFNILQRKDGDAIWDTSLWDTGTWGDQGIVPGGKDIDLYAESIRFRLSNSVVDQDFIFSNFDLRYIHVREERGQ